MGWPNRAIPLCHHGKATTLRRYCFQRAALPGRSTRLRNPPQFPVIIGVTGHRRIAPDAEQTVRHAVRVLLDQWRCHFGSALHVLTALADGADQLVADEARSARVPVIAVAPFPYAAYRDTVSNAEKLREHWEGAALKLTLPPVESSGQDDYHVRHYEQLGVLLIRRSHLLLGLWDGVQQPDRAGTTDVLRMRLEGDHGAASFHHSAMFHGANSYLDETNRGPLLHIFTPREPGQRMAEPAGACRLLGLPDPASDTRSSKSAAADWDGMSIAPNDVLQAIHRADVTDFTRIDELNRTIGRFHGCDDLVFHGQLRYLRITGIPAQGVASAWFLKRLQAGMDTAAQRFQLSLLGSFVPANNPREMVAKLFRTWRATRLIPKLGAVFWFAAALPLGVFFYELYVEAHNQHLGDAIWYLLGYLSVFGGTIAYYWLSVRRLGWQENFQDYRALAEALRVQLYWAIAGVPASVSDHYLRKQSGELGWIQFALRGPSLWAAQVAEVSRQPNREIIKTGWLKDQDDFFTARAELHHRAAGRGQALTTFFAVSGILGAIVLLALSSDGFMAWLRGWWKVSGPWLEELRQDHWLIVLTATLPAVAAFFSMSAELRNYEPHQHAYALMRRMFRRAAEVANRTGVSDAVFQDIVREIGREALAENAEWLVEHRHHKIEPR